MVKGYVFQIARTAQRIHYCYYHYHYDCVLHTRCREEATNGSLLQHRPSASCFPFSLASQCRLSQRAIKLVPHASLSLHTH